MLSSLEMARFFNSAGPCDPAIHYMLPAEERLPDLETLIERRGYFVVHAPRQTGKTTLFRSLADRLSRSGKFAAVYSSCEMGYSADGNVDYTVEGVVSAIDVHSSLLPDEQAPPDPVDFEDFDPQTRLRRYSKAWAESCPLPVVLFLDEVDALVRRRPDCGITPAARRLPRPSRAFPVVDRADRPARRARLPHRHRSSRSPARHLVAVQYQVESLRLRNFTGEEMRRLYAQHESETGQVFLPEATLLAWDLSRGQPWLVNALAQRAVESGRRKHDHRYP